VPQQPSPVVHLPDRHGRGPVWGAASEELNATLLDWPPGGGTEEHVNDERDVLVVVLAGSGTLLLDGETYALCAGDTCIVPKGTRRGFTAGPDGIRYLTAHRKRGGLQITPKPS
jgi:quercetin dioxygenase-like cupin family protein